MPERLSIAILGSRGIPNRYGGFEACAAELAARLVKKGHRVVVYTGSDHPVKAAMVKGVERRLIFNPERWLGASGQFVYDLLCNLDSRKDRFDIILHLGYTSDSIWFRWWAPGSRHVVNMDGQEWKRAKYSRPVKAFLHRAERMATLRACSLVADSPVIMDYLAQAYPVPVTYIPYGAEIPAQVAIGPADLVPGGYDLILARMEPENNIDMAIRAKIDAKDPVPLVIIGNENKYKRRLKRLYGHHRNIRFRAAVYETDVINAIRHHSRLYIHGHSVGGTNPSLLEAMACSCAIAAHDNPFNRSVLGEDGRYYKDVFQLQELFSGHNAEAYSGFIRRNLEKIHARYNWDMVTDSYEQLFTDAAADR